MKIVTQLKSLIKVKIHNANMNSTIAKQLQHFVRKVTNAIGMSD